MPRPFIVPRNARCRSCSNRLVRPCRLHPSRSVKARIPGEQKIPLGEELELSFFSSSVFGYDRGDLDMEPFCVTVPAQIRLRGLFLFLKEKRRGCEEGCRGVLRLGRVVLSLHLDLWQPLKGKSAPKNHRHSQDQLADSFNALFCFFFFFGSLCRPSA